MNLTYLQSVSYFLIVAFAICIWCLLHGDVSLD